MNKTVVISVMLFLAGSAYVQAQPLVQGTKKAVQSALERSAVQPVRSGNGILDKMDAWYTAGEHAVKQADFERRIEAARQLRVQQAKSIASRPVPLRTRFLHKRITPTPSNKLGQLQHPFLGKEYEFSKKYQETMNAFLKMRKEFNAKALHQSFSSQLSVEEKRILMDHLSEIRLSLEKLQRVYPKDEPIVQALEYVYFALGDINPMLKGIYKPVKIERPGRRFQKEEFIFDQMWFSQMCRMAWPPRKAALPADLRVALINDDQTVLSQYAAWQKQGVFPGWKITPYTVAEDVVRDIALGKKYDLVITDWVVPGSSVAECVNKLRTNGNTVPVIVCNSYTVDRINAQQMFNQGFDGYISWVEVSSRGVEYLKESLTQFFFYKDYYKW